MKLFYLLFCVVPCWAAAFSSLFSIQDITASNPCDVCWSGDCAHCNDKCLKDKTGDCASCWETMAPSNTSCLSDDPNVTACPACWAGQPCALCRTGSCARCEQCQNSTDGECKSCWEPDSNGYSCILPYQGSDCTGCWNVNEEADPLVVTSGLTASTLMATWTGVPGCLRNAKTPVQIWPWTESAGLLDIWCYIQVLQVEFDENTSTFHDRKGVHVSVVDFGGFDGLTFGDYMGYLDYNGYREGKNMYGAPFDWRLTSQGMGPFYKNLTKLIEHAYSSSGGKKVTLLAPSYGPQCILGFLQQQTQAWKDTYISWFVAASPVWSGSPDAYYAIASGIQLDPSWPPSLSGLVRAVTLRLPSLLWLVPQQGDDDFTYNHSVPFLSTFSKNYSAWDLESFFADIGFPELVTQYKYLHSTGALASFDPPLVNTYVNYGFDIPTANLFKYDSDFKPGTVEQATSGGTTSGDSIVPLRSSLRSTLWHTAQEKAGKRMIQKGYQYLAHAACPFPSDTGRPSDNVAMACFQDLMSLLVNGTTPTPDPPHNPHLTALPPHLPRN